MRSRARRSDRPRVSKGLPSVLRLLVSGVLVALALSCSAKAHATPGPSDPAEVEAFVDGLVAAQLDAYRIAGASVAVVRDGEILLLEGYGYANVAQRRPVDPEATLFRIGSVTKLFVWTAVMQLVEEGKLEMDRDVNAYLGTTRIPDTYPQPVTMRHLMTHTAGFDDTIVGLFHRDPSRMPSLEAALESMMPRRVLPPGEAAAYSNYGVALAAHLVARVAGMPWERYVEQRILEPLGMKGTTMRQPVEPALLPRLSKGYHWTEGRYRSLPFAAVTLAPAGSASATAGDMARFMIAHLEDGRGILSPTTVRRMREPLFSGDPRIGSMLHGAYEMRLDPVRAVGHGGDIFAFHTLLLMIPEHRTGLFLSYNSERGAEARDAFVQAFFERYFPPYVRPLSEVPEGASQRASEVAGTYLSTRRPHDSALKLSALLRAVRVRQVDGGLVTVHGPFPAPVWMVEQEPYLFRETLGDRTLVFRKNDGGEVDRAFFAHTPMVAFERAGTFETRSVQVATVFGFVSVFGLCLMTSVVAFLRRRSKQARKLPAKLAEASTATFCALAVLEVYAIARFLGDQDEVAFGMTASMHVALALPIVAAPFWLASAALAVGELKVGFLSVRARVQIGVTVLCGAAFYLWLGYWNLIGW